MRLAWMVASAVLPLLVMGYAQSSLARQSELKTFPSPGEASAALFQAVHNDDAQAVEAILGAGKELASSSDETVDKLEREQFSKKYQEMHRLVREPDGNTVLYVGAENWPFPIPLVSKNGAWYFDSETGKREVLFRRIGENEAAAIQVCHALIAAMKQPETKAAPDDPTSQYANGLVTAGTVDTDPFHGYYFRVVTVTSAAGPDRYSAAGKKPGRVAFVVYPAEYRSSGVMTFIVAQDGIVYEKDLGPEATRVAPEIKERSRNSKWHAAE